MVKKNAYESILNNHRTFLIEIMCFGNDHINPSSQSSW